MYSYGRKLLWIIGERDAEICSLSQKKQNPFIDEIYCQRPIGIWLLLTRNRWKNDSQGFLVGNKNYWRSTIGNTYFWRNYRRNNFDLCGFTNRQHVSVGNTYWHNSQQEFWLSVTIPTTFSNGQIVNTWLKKFITHGLSFGILSVHFFNIIYKIGPKLPEMQQTQQQPYILMN